MIVGLFLFLVDNTLIYWFEWPGLRSFLSQLALIGMQGSARELTDAAMVRGWIQFTGSLIAVVVAIFLILKTGARELDEDAELYTRISAFIVRASFWAVFLVGLVDALISFARVEGFLDALVGEYLAIQLGRPVFRGSYIHFPLILIAIAISGFTRKPGFIWLALLIVAAEFLIVITRFVFSYEQAFMGDLVRFWYAGLFLFASAYTLIEDGHVRVDVLYANFSDRGKALTNTLGSLFLGLPLCWNILIQGMSGKGSSINSPLLSFEISQSGFGMYTKYLMAAYLLIFAVSMAIQFVGFMLTNISVFQNSNREKPDHGGACTVELIFLGVLIALMIISLSSGFPVAFALPGSAIGAIVLAAICGYLFAGDASAYFAQDGPVQWLTAGVTNFRSLYWEVERDTLIAIPLFVFMGIMLQRSKIAEDLLVAMAQLFGPVPGGLGISVVFVGALLAATTGILGATVIAMGLISLPAMLRNNYSKPLASGTICASGALGQIIPPSIVLIILADQLANAADQARTLRAREYKEATGEFSMPAELDIASASAGDMFMGALIPGLILVGLYMLYILARAILKPGTAPPIPYDGQYDRKFFSKIAISLMPPLSLIFAVLGSIVAGVATVNQAGAIGAVGAIVMGGYRLQDGGRHKYTPLIIFIGSVALILLLLQSFELNVKNITGQKDPGSALFSPP